MYIIIYRTYHHQLDVDKLNIVHVEGVTKKGTNLKCEGHDCQDTAACYCKECGIKLCGKHKQVGNPVSIGGAASYEFLAIEFLNYKGSAQDLLLTLTNCLVTVCVVLY
jgi:hypothetical protein